MLQPLVVTSLVCARMCRDEQSLAKSFAYAMRCEASGHLQLKADLHVSANHGKCALCLNTSSLARWNVSNDEEKHSPFSLLDPSDCTRTYRAQYLNTEPV